MSESTGDRIRIYGDPFEDRIPKVPAFKVPDYPIRRGALNHKEYRPFLPVLEAKDLPAGVVQEIADFAYQVAQGWAGGRGRAETQLDRLVDFIHDAMAKWDDVLQEMRS